jgi:hypothetical protein
VHHHQSVEVEHDPAAAHRADPGGCRSGMRSAAGRSLLGHTPWVVQVNTDPMVAGVSRGRRPKIGPLARLTPPGLYFWWRAVEVQRGGWWGGLPADQPGSDAGDVENTLDDR